MNYLPIALFLLLIGAIIYTVATRGKKGANYNVQDGSNYNAAELAATSANTGILGDYAKRQNLTR